MRLYYTNCLMYSFTVIPKALQSVMNMKTLKNRLPIWMKWEEWLPIRDGYITAWQLCQLMCSD